MQASRAPWSTCPSCWNIFIVAKPVGSQTNASTPQDRRSRARHCRRWFRLTLGDVRGAAGRRGGRLECGLLPGRGRLPNPGARRRSPCLAAKMPCSGRCCCVRENVSSQVMGSSSASTLARRRARPRSCASTPSRSRFNTAVTQPGSRRKKTQQPWRRRVSRTGPRVSKKACLDTPRDRGAHVCCRVSVSAPVPASASCLRGSFFL